MIRKKSNITAAEKMWPFSRGMFEFDDEGKLSDKQIEKIVRKHMRYVYGGRAPFLHEGAPRYNPGENPLLDVEKDQFKKSWRETFNIGAVWIVLFCNLAFSKQIDK